MTRDYGTTDDSSGEEEERNFTIFKKVVRTVSLCFS